MSGKLYIGSPNAIVTPSREIFVGDSNNVARRVKGLFVGNSSNNAIKVYPSQQIPIDRYVQVEWLEVPQYVYSTTHLYNIVSYISAKDMPRLEMTFEFSENINDSLYGIFGGSLSSDYNVDRAFHGIGYACYISQRRFHFVFGYDPGRYEDATYNWYWDTMDSFSSTNSETILTGSRYTLIFNKIENSSSNFYLYNTEGYYSISRNNLIWTSSNNVVPDNFTIWYDERPYINLFEHNNDGYDTQPRGPLSNLYIYEQSKYYRHISPPKGFRLYSCRLFNKNDIPTRNFIPCYRKEDNKTGFYDTVDQIFIPNSINLTPGPAV